MAGLTGCATGNYNALDGECRRDQLSSILQNDSDDMFYLNCIEQRKKITEERAYQDKLKNDPEFLKQENARIAKEKKDAEVFEKNKSASLNANTPIATFKKYWGEPQTQEIINGQKLLWYDDQEKPFYVFFKNDLLTSFMIDRETIKQRQDAHLKNQQALDEERRHQDNLQAAKRAAALQYLSNSRPQPQQPYMMPTNNRPATIQQPVNTTCRKQFNGEVVCTSY